MRLAITDLYCEMQGESDENNDSSVFTAASSQHQSTDTEAAVSEQGISNGNSGRGYERVDPHVAEEARQRAERPSEYMKLDKVEDLYSLPKKKH